MIKTSLYKFGYFLLISENLQKRWKGANNGDQGCIWFTSCLKIDE